jgi:hypothetical protein
MATKPEVEKTPWETLSAIDLTDKIEKKNGMSYVSWAWAWGVLKKHYPYAWFRKHESSGSYPCFHDVQGYAFVKVTVGLDRTGDHEVTETFPVLDHRNKPVQGPSPFDINTALQRCLTKAIAYHGLGHYIYAGEDVPQDVAPTPSQASNEQPTAPVGGQVVHTPPNTVSAPPAPPITIPSAAPLTPPLGMLDPVHVYDHVGGVHWVERKADVMATCLLGFILFCTDDKMLTALYTSNRHIRDTLQAIDPEKHKHLLGEFSTAKKRLTEQTQGA